MADNTEIEWADATLNYVNGCDVISPGCTNCYAMRLAGTRMKMHPTRAGLTKMTKAGPVWTGEVRQHIPALLQALAWKRGRAIFWNAHGDLFHKDVPDEWIDLQFVVFAMTPQHKHMILTKRSQRMRSYFEILAEDPGERLSRAAAVLGFDEDMQCSVANFINGFSRWAGMPDDGNPLHGSQIRWPLKNVWVGVSVEDQKRAAERVPDLLAAKVAKRFASCEPLLETVDLFRISCWEYHGAEILNALTGVLQGMFGDYCETRLPALDLVIVGGESGPGARIMPQKAARNLLSQCKGWNVPFVFKQWGAWIPAGQYLPLYGKIHGGTVIENGKMKIHYGSNPVQHLYAKTGVDWHCLDDLIYFHVGKSTAGHILDRKEYLEMPK